MERYPNLRLVFPVIEMVQRRAARFMSSNIDRYASVTQMLNNIGWPTLSLRREKLRAVMFYKIVNNLVDVSTDGILNLITINTRGHSKRYKLNGNIDCFLHSFFPATIKIWNNLPENLTTYAALQDYKKTIFEIC